MLQQLAQQLSVGPVGLGSMLAAPRRLGVGRLGDVRLEPGRFDLLDHVAPTRATLHRHRDRMTVGPPRDVVASGGIAADPAATLGPATPPPTPASAHRR
jgi:hypothetical protein